MSFRSLLQVVGLLAFGACSSVRPLEYAEKGRELGVRTAVFEPAFSLYSPYGPIGTSSYVELITEELQAIAHLLQVGSVSPPISVVLEPAEGLGVDIEIEGDSVRFAASETPAPLYLGHAGVNGAVVAVGPAAFIEREDGVVLEGSYSPELYRETIRHELVHVLASRADIKGKPWFVEGVARTIEYMELREGRLVFGDLPEELQWLAGLPRASRGLRPLLLWEGPWNPPPPEARTLYPLAYAMAHSYVRYRVREVPLGDLPTFLRRLTSESRSEHLDHEAAWVDWIEKPH